MMAGCVTFLFYILAALLSLLMPLALSELFAASPAQMLGAIGCWLVPALFGGSFWLGRKALFEEVPKLAQHRVHVDKLGQPLTRAQRVVLIWMTADFLLLMLGISVSSAFSHVAGAVAWALVLFIAFIAILSMIAGYALGYWPLSDQRKLPVIFFTLLNLFFGGALIHDFWSRWPDVPATQWGAIVLGLVAGVVSVDYLQARWNPALLVSEYHSAAEARLDVLYLTNGCFRFFFYLALAALVLMLESLGEGVAITVVTLWLIMVTGYMSVQVWRHRPSPRSGLP